MTCRHCKIPMKQERPAHLFHGKRKWRCPDCLRIRMQKPKKQRGKHAAILD